MPCTALYYTAKVVNCYQWPGQLVTESLHVQPKKEVLFKGGAKCSPIILVINVYLPKENKTFFFFY